MAGVLICGDLVDSWRKYPVEVLEGLRDAIEDAVDAGLEPEENSTAKAAAAAKACSVLISATSATS